VFRHHLEGKSDQNIIAFRGKKIIEKYERTLPIFPLIDTGNHPLITTKPASFVSVVMPVTSVMAPPWLNPPSTILFAGVPRFISSAISPSMNLELSNIPSSSSGALDSNDLKSNLVEKKLNTRVSE
jgi:hypothetical protein